MPSVNTERSAISDQPAAACGVAVSESLPAVPGPSSLRSSGPASLESSGPASGKLYWRSLDELADTQEFRDFVAREFPATATELLDSADRRKFLKVMGASLALAGLGTSGTGCRRWPDERIAPYAHRPPGRTPGEPVQYATTMELGGVASGLLVTSYDGRPIKIEGNPLHSINHGATDVLAQASILDLYDPDRGKSVVRGGKSSDWSSFARWAKSYFASARSGLAILCEATSSPSVLSMKQRLMKVFPEAAWHEYEPLNNDNELKGSTLAFGSPFRAQYAFDKAMTIVALDSDFLHCHPGAVKWTRDYANSRRAQDRKTMSRLYMFESGVSLTGANADHRVAIRSADVRLIAARLAAKVMPVDAALASLASTPLPAVSQDQDIDKVLEHLLDDLKHGPSIVIAGPRQPAEVHLLAHLINETLGNIGKTITYTPLPDAQPHVDSIRTLASDIKAGKIQTLVIIGGNPVYNAPADLNFSDLVKGVQTTIHLSEYVDETSQVCSWHINRSHYLESWGDGRAYDGTLSIAQPLIDPLFGGKSAIELLAAISGDEMTGGYDIVRRTVQEMGSGMDFEGFWRKALHDGVIANSAVNIETPPKMVGPKLDQHVQALAQSWSAAKADDLEVVFVPDVGLHDGRFANNGWLQELPDPIAKLTWDNAILMSPAAAAARGLRTGDMVELKLGSRTVKAAVLALPGHHAGSVTLTLGYGREFAGRIAAGSGFNFYALRSAEAMSFASGASMTKTGESYPLAITQDHHAVDSVAGEGTQERLPTLFREATLDEYQHHPDFVNHRTHVVHRLSLWEEDHPFHAEEGRRGSQYAWAMSIDLNACTGCNACVIACQAENNIPIVGKDQVKRGREMHWIRVDRYFKGSNPERPDSFMLSPVTCMHCENAPCEEVCPVAATVHDDQGLNVMVYNRCVGTRYCSNNCPYKVRRFNYFDYHVRKPHREQPGMLLHVEPDYYAKGQAQADPLKQMQFNPEVTVRMRGIMEKCTYCVQRITKARIDAKDQWVKARNLDPAAPLNVRVPIEDGTVIPACAQACPAQAIVFGDLNDPQSKVRQLHKHERSYQMLEELNSKPRTRYMAKLRNPAFERETANDNGNGHAPPDDGGHG